MTKIIIEDDEGNKKIIDGKIEGFVVKTTKKRFKNVIITGLDETWYSKKILCVLIGNVNETEVILSNGNTTPFEEIRGEKIAKMD